MRSRETVGGMKLHISVPSCYDIRPRNPAGMATGTIWSSASRQGRLRLRLRLCPHLAREKSTSSVPLPGLKALTTLCGRSYSSTPSLSPIGTQHSWKEGVGHGGLRASAASASHYHRGQWRLRRVRAGLELTCSACKGGQGGLRWNWER